ncbi:MAG: aldo/keto reductase, partial [Clostridia bacterium]|nr:aldo/keto reductase [Clostridia bacterium]
MKYRLNQRTGDHISEIGMGSAYLPEADFDEGVRALRRAYEGGVNYFDLAAGDGKAFPMWGEALSDVRSRVLFQIHFGADYTKGTYGWSLRLDTIKRSVEWQLKTLKTDHIDYGFIHCQDEE